MGSAGAALQRRRRRENPTDRPVHRPLGGRRHLGGPWVAKRQAIADTTAAFFVEAREVPSLLVSRKHSDCQRAFAQPRECHPVADASGLPPAPYRRNGSCRSECGGAVRLIDTEFSIGRVRLQDLESSPTNRVNRRIASRRLSRSKSASRSKVTLGSCLRCSVRRCIVGIGFHVASSACEIMTPATPLSQVEECPARSKNVPVESPNSQPQSTAFEK